MATEAVKKVNVVTSTEHDVVQVIMAWATAFPGEVKAFDRQMKHQRQLQYKANGVSRDGNMALYGEIPVKLFRAMQLRYGRFWDRDQFLLQLFWQNFIVGKINKRARAYKAVEDV